MSGRPPIERRALVEACAARAPREGRGNDATQLTEPRGLQQQRKHKDDSRARKDATGAYSRQHRAGGAATAA